MSSLLMPRIWDRPSAMTSRCLSSVIYAGSQNHVPHGGAFGKLLHVAVVDRAALCRERRVFQLLLRRTLLQTPARRTSWSFTRLKITAPKPTATRRTRINTVRCHVLIVVPFAIKNLQNHEKSPITNESQDSLSTLSDPSMRLTAPNNIYWKTRCDYDKKLLTVSHACSSQPKLPSARASAQPDFCLLLTAQLSSPDPRLSASCQASGLRKFSTASMESEESDLIFIWAY